MELRRQHLIDPVVCIRCNTCQEACPVDAITHDSNNYVVSFEKCSGCRACVSPCPTGAIDNWLLVDRPWTLDEQLGWEELPESHPSHGATIVETPAEVSDLMNAATTATGGKTPPPPSAAQPFTNVYSRESPVTARVAGNMRITAEGTESDIHHVVLDFQANAFPVLEGQSIGVIPPGLDAKGRPHNIRLYSVASPRDGVVSSIPCLMPSSQPETTSSSMRLAWRALRATSDMPFLFASSSSRVIIGTKRSCSSKR